MSTPVNENDNFVREFIAFARTFFGGVLSAIPWWIKALWLGLALCGLALIVVIVVALVVFLV